MPDPLRLAAAAAVLAAVTSLPAGAAPLAPQDAGRPAAAGTIDWIGPTNLSQSPESSGRAAIVADEHGLVHVVWSERVGDGPLPAGETIGNGNTLFYTRWDGSEWLPPRGVLYVEGDAIANWVSLGLDAEQRLHAVWKGAASYFYSSAPAARAELPTAWRSPLELAEHGRSRTQWSSDLTFAPDGTLHVVYGVRRPEPAVFHVRRAPGSMTFGAPVRLSQPLPEDEEQPGPMRVVAGSDGRIHAAWSTDTGGFGQAIYYARADPSGQRWEPARQLAKKSEDDFGYAYPYLAVGTDDELHLVYTYRTIVGRVHQVSSDGGATWSAPRHVLQELHGVNGFVMPLFDDAGTLHLLINMRTARTAEVGLYYSRWENGEWTPATVIDNEGPGAAYAHWSSAALRLGNEIHLTYTSNRGGEIWHLRGRVPGVAARPARPLPARPDDSR